MAARPQSSPQTSGEQQQQGGLEHPVLDGVAAAALAAGGAQTAGLVGSTVAAGAPVGLALTAAAIAKITAETVENTVQFMRTRVRTRAKELREFLADHYPEQTASAIQQAVAGEVEREREFSRKMQSRLRTDLPKALAVADPDERRAAVQRILSREQRYLKMREDAMTDRAVAFLERLSVKRASPEGAYWHLSPFVTEHTPDCIALGEKFWPWSVLDEIHPPTHHGCRCELLTKAEAVRLNYMDPEHANVVDYDALARAKKLLKEAELVLRVASLEEFRSYLAELEEAASTGGAMVALYPSKQTQRKLAAHPEADEPAEQVHLTAVFLGPDAGAIADKRGKVRAAVRAAAAKHGPMRGEVGGVGAFSGDGKQRPLVALADVPGLGDFRSTLMDELRKRGVESPSDHDFTPHLTMRYVPEGEKMPVAEPPDKLPLRFSDVHLVWAGEHETFPLARAIEEGTYRPFLHLRDRRGRWRDMPQAARPGSPAADLEELRTRWASLDRALLRYAGEPNARGARRIIDEQQVVTKLIHHHHLDEGGPGDVGKPGGPADVVIVGAGPAGLSAAIYGASEGLDTTLIDAGAEAGGQARMSSRIENVLGFPAGITGEQLATMSLDQARRLGAECQFGVKVDRLSYDPQTGMKHLELSDGRTLDARTVVIAGGVQFRTADFPGSDSPDVVYGSSAQLRDRTSAETVIVGGANSAGQAAIDAAAHTKHVTLVVRRDIAATMSSYLIEQLRSDPKVTIVEHAEVERANLDRNGRMRSVTLKGGSEVPAKAMLLAIGSGPQADWAGVERDEHGYIVVNHGDPLETSMPGVYAAGDVRSGSIHRVITAAADGAAAISMTHGYLAHLRGDVQEAASTSAAGIPDDDADRWMRRVYRYDMGVSPPGPSRISEALESGELVEVRLEPLRYGKGVREGGQFRPRLGGHPHPLDRAKRRLFHELFPELPRSPRDRSHVRRRVNLDGRLVDVPEQRSFERRLGGHRYSSPVGSTEVYRDGKPFSPVGTTGQRRGSLDVGLRPNVVPLIRARTQELGVADLRAQELEQRARAAVAAGSPGQPPAEVGQAGFETDEALRRAGFIETDFRDTSAGLQFSYTASDGVSDLAITYSRDGSQVAQVDWTPGRQPTVAPPLDRPPHTWQEYVDDLETFARTTARAHGRNAHLGAITVDPEMEDHQGIHEWGGSVKLAPDVQSDILTAAAVRGRGGTLTEGEKRNVWASTVSGIHEMLHAANPVGRDGFDGVGQVLEEGLTEELARQEAVKRLRLQGQDDIVQWLADHPTDPKAIGTYSAYRQAIDEVLNDAGVPAEQRGDTLERLKLDTSPGSRVDVLAGLVGQAKGLDPDKARARVTRLLAEGEDAQARREFTGMTPILAANADPSPQGHTHELGGRPLNVGDRVTANLHRHGLNSQYEGTVTAIRDVDDGFLIDADFGIHGHELSLPPRKVVAVESRENGDRLIMGAQASTIDGTNGQPVTPGTLIRYDGRADHQTSQARVVRIIRDTNPATDTPGDYLIEAVTTTNSARPGTRVLLTPERTGGLLEPVADVIRSQEGRGRQRTLVPLTLERHALLARHFDMPPGSAVVQTGSVRVGTHPRPSRLRQEIARLQDPAAARRLPPLVDAEGVTVGERDSAGVVAMERLGYEHVPVRVPRQQPVSGLADLRARHPDVELEVRERPYGLVVSMIRTREGVRGQGKAAAALDDLLGYADTHGLTVGLTPDPVGKGMSKAALREWYARRGFRRNRSNFEFSESMVREPRPSGARQESLDVAAAEPSPLDPDKLYGGEVVRDKAGKDWRVVVAFRKAKVTQVSLRPEGEPKAVPRSVKRAQLKGWLFVSGKPSKPSKPSPVGGPVDAKKLRGGELVTLDHDPDGKTWRVQLTGSNDVPTVTLRDLAGHEETFAEAELPKATLVQAGYGSFTSVPSFPATDDAGVLKMGKFAGGSNDAHFATDAQGVKWLVKPYRGDADRVATELLANAIYRKLGIRVPEAGTVSVKGKPALAYPLVEGELRHWDTPNAELGQGFMADALLANWDVVGLGQDNVIWDADGHPVRLDQGGSLQYRAQGQRKTFGPVPSEVWSMASPNGGQAFGTMELSPEVKRQGARRIAKTLTPAAIDELVDAAPFADEKMRQEVRDALKARTAWMADYAAGKVSEPAPLSGASARQSLLEAQAGVKLHPEQQVAVEALVRGWDGVVNDHLRTGAAKAAASKEVRFLIRELDSLTRLVKAPGDMEAYTVLAVGEDPAGKVVTDKGYMALATDPDEAAAAAATGVPVRVLIPRGTPVLAPGLLPGMNGGQPELILPRGVRVRILRSQDGLLEGAVVR